MSSALPACSVGGRHWSLKTFVIFIACALTPHKGWLLRAAFFPCLWRAREYIHKRLTVDLKRGDAIYSFQALIIFSLISYCLIQVHW